MKIHNFGEVELHISNEIIRDFEINSQNDLENKVYYTLKCFINNNPKYEQYIKEFSKLNNLKDIIMLNAHGDEKDNKYIYWDENKFFLVQDWINDNDGRKAVLLLRCCNPGSLKIHSRKSIVLVPNYNFSEFKQDFGDVTVEMYAPKKGYIPSYLMDYELEQIRKITKLFSI